MTARWDWPRCDCTWQMYLHTCHKPQHVVFALRDRHDPKLPLIFSAPCPDYLPASWSEAS